MSESHGVHEAEALRDVDLQRDAPIDGQGRSATGLEQVDADARRQRGTTPHLPDDVTKGAERDIVALR